MPKIPNKLVGPAVLRYLFRYPVPPPIATFEYPPDNPKVNWVQIATAFVGPPVLRLRLKRQPTKFWWIEQPEQATVLPGLIFGGYTIVPGPTLVPNFNVGPIVLRNAYRRRVIPMTTPTNARNIVGLSSASLSFTGPTNLVKITSKTLNAAGLSFTGPTNLKNVITKTLTSATLIFTGTITKSINKQLALASLTFTGTTLKSISKSFVATLTSNSTFKKAINIQFIGANLNLIGSLPRKTSKVMSSVLTFTGTFIVTPLFSQHLTKNLVASLSFNGNITKNTSKKFLTTVLSFFGSVSTPPVAKPILSNVAPLTLPSTISVATTEIFPYTVDVSSYLSGTDTVSLPWTTLLLSSTGSPVTIRWRSPIIISGNQVNFSIFGSALRLGQKYQLTLTFVANANKIVSLSTFVNIVLPDPLAAGTLNTLPATFPVSIKETAWPYTVDVSSYLSGTDTIVNPTVTLTLLSTGEIISGWQNSIVISGNLITTNMNISKLRLGQSYQIAVNFVATGTIQGKSSIVIGTPITTKFVGSTDNKKPTYTSIIQVVA